MARCPVDGTCMHSRLPGSVRRGHSSPVPGRAALQRQPARHGCSSQRQRRGQELQAEQGSSSTPGDGSSEQPAVTASMDGTYGLAPVKPQTPVGKMLSYYLKMEPHLFKATLETQLQRLKEEKDQAQERADVKVTDSTEVVLYRRLHQLQASEARMGLEDIMYVSVLEKFLDVGVEMMSRPEPQADDPSTLKALTEGIHTAEALDMVKEHVRALLGPATVARPTSQLQMSKLQAAQVYAASIMFGYFVRRVDRRFQLESKLGMLPEQQEDPVARLERLFSKADNMELVQDPDAASPSHSSPDPDAAPSSPSGSEVEQQLQDMLRAQSGDSASSSSGSSGRGSSGSSGGGSSGSGGGPDGAKKGALRKYIESFDRDTLTSMARLVSTEGASLVERQTAALYGDLKQLQKQMQEAVGQDANSMQELMERVHHAVGSGKVDVINVTVATQKRSVLEAVAFGTFLRDVETYVDSEYALLTPAPAMGGGSEGGGGGLAGVS